MATASFNDAPISWVLNTVADKVSAVSATSSSLITDAITPIVFMCFCIYVILMMVHNLWGDSQPSFGDYAIKLISWALIIGIGLSAEGINNYVMPIASNIGNDLANVVSNGTVSENSLDQLALAYLKIIGDGFATAAEMDFIDQTLTNTLLLIKTAIILIGLVPFLVVATLLILIAKVGVMLIVAVAPIFFAFLLFPATRQYFSAWLNSVLSMALMPIFIAIISMVSVQMSLEAMGNNGIIEASMETVILLMILNLILMGLLKWVSVLASSLSNGGVNLGHPNPFSSINGMSRTMSQSKREAIAGYKAGRWAYNNTRGTNKSGGTIKPG